MPGVSATKNASGPPTCAWLANDPGFVPSRVVDGLCAPRSGNVQVMIGSLSFVARGGRGRACRRRFPTPVLTGSGSAGSSQRHPFCRAPSDGRTIAENPVPGQRRSRRYLVVLLGPSPTASSQSSRTALPRRCSVRRGAPGFFRNGSSSASAARGEAPRGTLVRFLHCFLHW
jgi:hypothetical protein